MIIDLCSAIGSFITYLCMTAYLWWLLGLDEKRFIGQKGDFRVGANVNVAEVKLDLMQMSGVLS